MGIKRLEIGGFKSIDSITLTDMPNYCVFAGANGSGKSNFFDALKFASTVIDDGATKAVRRFGGYDLIHCVKRKEQDTKSFHFVCGVQFPAFYIQGGVEAPLLQQDMYIRLDGTRSYAPQKHPILNGIEMRRKYDLWLRNYYIYRFDPFLPVLPSEKVTDPNFLDQHGRNLTSVLEEIQKRKNDFATVTEWMNMIVPGLERVVLQRNPLDGQPAMAFHERGIDRPFPAGLISDGTVYVLCLLAAVLTRIKQPGITMIEEPERGIHPYAIEQLSAFFREHASDEHQIFISTHNESFVRNAKPEELFFGVKEDGRTQFRLGRDCADAVEGMPNDKAWLQNMFDGGLPW